MGRLRTQDRQTAKAMYLKAKGNIRLKDIAIKLDASESQVRNWKAMDKWDMTVKNNNANLIKDKIEELIKLSDTRGDPFNDADKYIPDRLAKVISEIQGQTPIDIIYTNILILHANILRSQEIMFVNDKNDVSREIKKEVKSDFGTTIEYNIAFAFEKQGMLLSNLSKATQSLVLLMRQYEEMLYALSIDRRAEYEVKIAKIRAETIAIQSKVLEEKDASETGIIMLADIIDVEGVENEQDIVEASTEAN